MKLASGLRKDIILLKMGKSRNPGIECTAFAIEIQRKGTHKGSWGSYN